MIELKKLWAIKRKKKLSDKALEKELGVDRMTIWAWRNEKRNPSALAREKIRLFVKKYDVFK